MQETASEVSDSTAVEPTTLDEARKTDARSISEPEPFAARIDAAMHAVCRNYGLDTSRVFLRQMGGTNGGLGNAIPLPIPFRRRYLVRHHECMQHADADALRGLFAHELMHVLHYSKASYLELLKFIVRYLISLGSFSTPFCIGRRWTQDIEHLTDLMGVRQGEGRYLAAWKRFKSEAIRRGDIADGMEDLYLDADELDSLVLEPGAVNERIDRCVDSLGAVDALHPLRRAKR